MSTLNFSFRYLSVLPSLDITDSLPLKRAVFEHFIVVHISPIAGVPHVPLVVAVVVVGPHHIKLLSLLQVNLLLGNSAHFLGPMMNIIEYLKMFIKLFSAL